MTTPVYICTGFLDSGKTTFIKDTLMKQEWIEEGPTLLLQCEEGEEEYSEKYLDENGLFLFNIEEREKLNKTLVSSIDTPTMFNINFGTFNIINKIPIIKLSTI